MKQTINEDEQPPEEASLLEREQRGGSGYYLDSDVKAQIQEALVMDRDHLLQRARAKRNSADFLREETLVYLIREFLRANIEDDLVLKLTEILEKRARTSINNRFLGLDESLAEQLVENVIFNMLSKLFSPPYDHGDFMEAKFLRYIYYRAIDERRKYGDEDGPEYHLVPLTNENGEDLDIPELEDGNLPSDQPPIRELEDKAISNHFRMEVLPGVITNPDHLEAYVLREYYNWRIESKDGSTQSLSKHYEVEPRTIHNWLRTADNQVKAWRKGQSHGEANE